jgi:hypothetical protein
MNMTTARQCLAKHIYMVTQSTVGPPLLTSSQSSLGVQQTISLDMSNQQWIPKRYISDPAEQIQSLAYEIHSVVDEKPSLKEDVSIHLGEQVRSQKSVTVENTMKC